MALKIPCSSPSTIENCGRYSVLVVPGSGIAKPIVEGFVGW